MAFYTAVFDAYGGNALTFRIFGGNIMLPKLSLKNWTPKIVA
jgi:hypothetical protein